MSSENANVMIIQNEHEIYFNGITMKKIVNWSFQIENNKTKRNVKEQMKIKIAKIACSKENVERT
jgi:hypothetical protein